MLSRLFIILLFVPFLLWIFLKGNVMFLVFTLVIIGMSLFEFYKMLKDKGFEVASRIGMGLGLFLPVAIYFQENSKNIFSYFRFALFKQINFDMGGFIVFEIILLSLRQVLKVKIGTPIGSLIEECGGLFTKPESIVLNGLMTGFIIDNLDTPVSKFLKSVCIFGKETVKVSHIHECINCGLCFNSCPFYLEPKRMVNAIEKNIIDDEVEQFIGLCNGCGCCSACCSARIPLSAIIADAKERLLRRTLV